MTPTGLPARPHMRTTARRTSPQPCPLPRSSSLSCSAPARGAADGAYHEPHPHRPRDASYERRRLLRQTVARTLAAAILVAPVAFLRAAPERLRLRLGYKLDVWYSTSRRAKAVSLLALTLALWLAGTVFLVAASGEDAYEELWTALAGAGVDWQFAGAHRRSGAERIVAALIAVGGTLMNALGVGVVSDMIATHMDQLRKGRSDVLERDHMVLGWSDKVFPLVRQLLLCLDKEHGGTVVVLADLPKEEMDGRLARMLGAANDKALAGVVGRGNTRIVCRRGSPMLITDLKKVNVHRARGVVLLREGGVETADGTDAKLLRAVLALAWIAEKSGLRGHAVVEVKWAANRHLVEKLGGARVEVLASREFQARLLLVCARQPGLSFVYDDLLGFEGSEFHTAAFPELAGATLGAVVHRFRTACVVGVVEAANEGHVTLNPPDTYVLQADDRLIMLAEDEESVVLAPDAPLSDPVGLARWRSGSRKQASKDDLLPEKLVLTYDEFAPPSSELWFLGELGAERQRASLLESGAGPERLKNVTVHHLQGSLSSRAAIDALPLEDFTSIIITADNSSGVDEDPVSVDSRTMATLLLLRDVQTERVRTAEPDVLRRHLSAVPSFLRDHRGGAVFTSARTSGGAPPATVAESDAEEEDDAATPGATPVTETQRSASAAALTPAASAERLSQQEAAQAASWLGATRDLMERSQCEVIVEVLDQRTRHLIDRTKMSEYCMTQELLSRALAQIAEDRAVNAVLSELLASDGHELYIVPLSEYITREDEEVSFYDLSARARKHQEVLLGWWLEGMPRAQLNPPDKLQRRSRWTATDRVVVLADWEFQ